MQRITAHFVILAGPIFEAPSPHAVERRITAGGKIQRSGVAACAEPEKIKNNGGQKNVSLFGFAILAAGRWCTQREYNRTKEERSRDGYRRTEDTFRALYNQFWGNPYVAEIRRCVVNDQEYKEIAPVLQKRNAQLPCENKINNYYDDREQERYRRLADYASSSQLNGTLRTATIGDSQLKIMLPLIGLC
jgi:hypothetical protein